jgi:hypothetical protein
MVAASWPRAGDTGNQHPHEGRRAGGATDTNGERSG